MFNVWNNRLVVVTYPNSGHLVGGAGELIVAAITTAQPYNSTRMHTPWCHSCAFSLMKRVLIGRGNLLVLTVDRSVLPVNVCRNEETSISDKQQEQLET